jgi:PiT family inorganic phosphate transporter
MMAAKPFAEATPMTLALLLVVTLLLAFSNGANDNFKGVATLYGSGTAGYRTVLTWATLTTFAGSVASAFLAAELLKRFSGGGVVPDALVKSSTFLSAVGFGGAATIFLATLLGMPTSTTHALTGALIGAGLIADPHGVNVAALGVKFFLPLLASPLLAVAITGLLYGVLHGMRVWTGIRYADCLCVRTPELVPTQAAAALSLAVVGVGSQADCAADPAVAVNIPVKRSVDLVHFLCGGAVCFARSLNDTPKIAALLLVGGTLANWKLGALALAMAVGGVLGARKVARVMSRKIADLNEGQGMTASVVTALLVLAASTRGLPVSTTHVSVSAILGIGLVNRRAQWKTVGQIGLAWLLTLPAGLLLGAAAYALMTRLGAPAS